MVACILVLVGGFFVRTFERAARTSPRAADSVKAWHPDRARMPGLAMVRTISLDEESSPRY
ncbi:hypothetical protein GCM10017557_03630 [Streptomyces aurantiacus]|uniref:Uncharacterized protein n=1 Tax=Streptomyces aurantiacus TaxID=47760 RepID=A0A7G1NV43_9ACTN|nr:hypothetical protein GCM10017557_03630 [Streptomyces aurantiacus]